MSSVQEMQRTMGELETRPRDAAPPGMAVLAGDLNLLRCFAGRNIPFTVVSCDPTDLVLRSRHARRTMLIADPRTRPAQALADLMALGKLLRGRPALMFDNEPFLLLVSRNREVLSRYFRFLLPDAQLVEDMANKVRFEALARRLNLPVPATVLSSESSADSAARALSLPCIFKPITHVGWYRSRIVREAGGKPYKALLANTRAEFDRLWRRMSEQCGEFVVQEFIPGGDDCIYSFHTYIDADFRPLGQFVGRKIRTFPKTSGVSTYLRLIKEPELERLGREILDKMDFVGAVKLDFKKDPQRGRYYLLEMNSRFNLWNHLGAANGINLPYLAYLDLYGQKPQPIEDYRTGVRWLSFGNDLRAFTKGYHADGDLSWMKFLWSLRGRHVHDVFAWSDPWPWIVAAGRYIGAAAGKAWRRIRATGIGRDE